MLLESLLAFKGVNLIEIVLSNLNRKGEAGSWERSFISIDKIPQAQIHCATFTNINTD